MRIIAGDITDQAHRSALVDSAREAGSLDLVVNNASTLGPSPLPPSRPLSAGRAAPGLRRERLCAPLALIQASLPLLRAVEGNGGVGVIGCRGRGLRGLGRYGSSKAALDQLHRVLAAEEPEFRVYLFDPGDMRTEMHQAAFPVRTSPIDPSPNRWCRPCEGSWPRTSPAVATRPRPWRSHDRADRARAIHLRAPTALEASEPPEARGLTRDAVRMLVTYQATGHWFRAPSISSPGSSNQVTWW